MKKWLYCFISAVCCLGLAACATEEKQAQNQNYQRKKIYLTEQDYLDDLGEAAQAERREAKPKPESDYIFELQPETQKNVYFFDERVRPMVPGQPSERDYKNTKRLWERPRRYSPEQYYGNQPQEPETTESSSRYNSYSYDDDY